MRLADLEPHFVRHSRRVETWQRMRADKFIEEVTGPRDFLTHVQTLAVAQGVFFLCPKCFAANNGPVGTHGLYVFFSGCGVPEDFSLNREKQPVRLEVSGGGLEDLTLAPSILIQGGCGWHGFVRNGQIVQA